jgi:hypothetical protein
LSWLAGVLVAGVLLPQTELVVEVLVDYCHPQILPSQQVLL